MNERVGKLKNSSGWFAAGREVSRALGLLSDGAFKVYIHLCLKADRSTGLLSADHGDLVQALGKSRRSIVTYLEELRQHGVCRIQPAANQHSVGEIEICDGFWPYDHQSRDSIVSFSYFQNVIEEVRELKMSAEYWRHLQTRVDRLEQQWAEMKTAAAARDAPS